MNKSDGASGNSKLDIALLKELIDAYGPSGYEYQVREIILREIKKYVHEVHIDQFGNLVAHKKGKGKRIMLAAHMDEIALMAKQITPEGKIYFVTVGDIEPVTLIGQRVCLLAHKRVGGKGVVTFEDLQNAYPITKTPEVGELYVDTGLDGEGLARIGVKIGTYMIPEHSMQFTDGEHFFCGKALDDRIGCFVLIELAKRLKHVEIDTYYVFTVQEEVGLYGASTAVELIKPDWGIAVDVTNAEDAGDDPHIVIGKGPCVVVKDAEIIANKYLNDHFELLSKKHKIPLQFKVDEFGTTDATKIMMSKGGIPSTVLGIALRNIHSTIAVASIKDVQWAIDLLELLLSNPPQVHRH